MAEIGSPSAGGLVSATRSLKGVDMSRTAASKTEYGASAVEYALLVAAIAAVIVLIVFALGLFVGETFNDTCNAMDAQSSLASAATC